MSSDIHYHCRKGNLDTVIILINEGVDVNEFNHMVYTPLHIACIYNRAPIVQLLLTAGADHNIVDKQGRTPLMNAIRCQSTTILDNTTLFNQLSDSQLHIDNHRNSELHYAARFNSHIIQQLCEHRKLRDYTNSQGLTPLHIAARHGSFTNFDSLAKIIPTNQWNPENGQPILNVVVSSDDHIIARVQMIELIYQELKGEVYSDDDGYNGLHVAIVNGLNGMCELLIDLYPGIVNSTIKNGDGPLDLAIIHNHSIISYLMDNGAQPQRLKDKRG